MLDKANTLVSQQPGLGPDSEESISLNIVHMTILLQASMFEKLRAVRSPAILNLAYTFATPEGRP
jgi:hypothetical protein